MPPPPPPRRPRPLRPAPGPALAPPPGAIPRAGRATAVPRTPPAPPLRFEEPLPTRLPGAPQSHFTENPAATSPAGSDWRAPAVSSGGWLGLVAKDLLWSQWPVPEHPGQAAMREFAGKVGR